MVSLEEFATFCKKKGFIYQNSEIYGGLAGFFDYGPLGVELKNNLKQHWWNRFVKSRSDVVGIDGTIISHPQVWVASGHVEGFNDILIECSKCHSRLRGDHLIEDVLKIQADGLSAAEIDKLVTKHKLTCPNCKGKLNKAGKFNLMFSTQVGPKSNSEAYLRPETAQNIFVNFKNIVDTQRVKLPFGIAQIGKAFRNEISPRDFLFRTREFELMEIEFFIHPDQKDCPLLTAKDKNLKINLLSSANQKKKQPHQAAKIGDLKIDSWHAYWLKQNYQWFLDLGINPKNLRLREHLQDELAHYSSACFDIEYQFPFGWKEIHGNANRGQFDLTQHAKISGKKLDYFDEETQEKVLPRVIEPSQGVDRAFLAFLYDAYTEDKKRGNLVLKLKPILAPFQVAVFPLVKKDKQLVKLAQEIYDDLHLCYPTLYDESGSVGRRYARADEMGVPFCLTIDFDSLEDKKVTIRSRDSTDQIRVKIEDLTNFLFKLRDGSKLESLGKLVK